MSHRLVVASLLALVAGCARPAGPAGIVSAPACDDAACVQVGCGANYLTVQRAQRGRGPFEFLLHDASRVTTHFDKAIRCVVVDQPDGNGFGYDTGANRAGYGYLVLPAHQGQASFIVGAGVFSGFEGGSVEQQSKALLNPDRAYTVSGYEAPCESSDPTGDPKFAIHLDADRKPYVTGMACTGRDAP